jgi:hypothetical protein
MRRTGERGSRPQGTRGVAHAAARYVKLVRRIAEAKRDREQDEQATRQAGRRSPKCFQSRQMSLNGSSDVAV